MAAQLSTRERRTLEVGSSVLLSALLVGMQFGEWPVWSAPAVVAGYCAWVIAYSEATVQLDRRRARRRDLSARSEPAPGDEE